MRRRATRCNADDALALRACSRRERGGRRRPRGFLPSLQRQPLGIEVQVCLNARASAAAARAVSARFATRSNGFEPGYRVYSWGDWALVSDALAMLLVPRSHPSVALAFALRRATDRERLAATLQQVVPPCSTPFADLVPTATLARLAADFLRQGQRLVARLDDVAYCAPMASLSRSSVGAHLRHMMDHFTSLLDGAATGVVDYDIRARDPQIENDRIAAIAALHSLEHALAQDRMRRDREMQVLVDSGERGMRSRSRSSMQRELQFCIAHAVHHYAIIALLLRARGIEVEPGFGVAPSTQKHEAVQRQETIPQCAR